MAQALSGLFRKFFDLVIRIERDKLYYYSLANTQKTLVVTPPSDNKEQKAFLGYDWSNRKGSEGIIVNSPGGKLYNDQDRFAHCTVAAAIRNSFMGAVTKLPEELQQYTSTYKLVDMLDFKLSNFTKTIRLKPEKSIEIQSKYPLVNLGSVAEVGTGNSAPKREAFTNGIFPFFRTADVGAVHLSKSLCNTTDYLNEQGIVNLRKFNKGTILFPKSGASTYLDHRVIMGVDGYVTSHLATIIANEDVILTEFLYEVLTLIKAKDVKPGSGYPSLNKSDIENIKIPLPPLDIQEHLIKQCRIVDGEYESSRMAIETYRQKIADIFDELEVVNKTT